MKPKKLLISAIASKYIQVKQPNKASQILVQAFAIAQTIPGLESKTIVFKKDYDSQGNLISKLEVDDPYDRASLLQEIAIGYVRAGQYNQALQVAQAIQDAATRQQVRQRLC